MTLQEALHTYLAQRAALTDLVATRIYTNHLPESPVFPCVSIRFVSGEHEYTLDGPNGIVRAKVQIESWSEDYRQLLNVAEQVRLAVHGYAGDLSGLDIHNTALDTEVETPEPPQDDSENWLYSKAFIFNIRYLEAIPSH